jgi:hypothetical protein
LNSKAEAKVRSREVPPTADESFGLIEALMVNFETATVIIDALDNCVSLDESMVWEFTYIRLLSKLLQIMSESRCRIKLLISSRLNTSIEKTLRLLKDGNFISRQISPHSISTDEQPADDIARLIRQTVENWSPAEFLPSEEKLEVVAQAKHYVINSVTEKAEVMWVFYFTSSCCLLFRKSI